MLLSIIWLWTESCWALTTEYIGGLLTHGRRRRYERYVQEVILETETSAPTPPMDTEDATLGTETSAPNSPIDDENGGEETLAPNPPTNVLHRLPVELIVKMLDRLHMCDRESVGLCNHQIRRIFLDKPRDEAWKKTEDLRRDFLTRLTRDWPEFYYCSTCFRLHSRYRSGTVQAPLWRRRRGLTCRMRDYADSSYQFNGTRHPRLFRLEFTLLRSVMQGHRHNHEYGASIECIPFAHVRSDGMTVVVCAEPRIVSRHMYIRIQDRIEYDIQEGAPDARRWGAQVCIHRSVDHGMQELITCKRDHMGEDFLCITCPPRLRCVVCAAEFELVMDWHQRGKRMYQSLTLTTWLNVGGGFGIDDWLWTRHMVVVQDRSRIPYLRAGYSVENIRERFEAQEGQSLESLTLENSAITMLQDGFDRMGFRPLLVPGLEQELKPPIWIRNHVTRKGHRFELRDVVV